MPSVARMTITLSPTAVAKIEERLYALSRAGQRISTSAFLETAALELAELPIEEAAEILNRHGASQRRKAT